MSTACPNQPRIWLCRLDGLHTLFTPVSNSLIMQLLFSPLGELFVSSLPPTPRHSPPPHPQSPHPPPTPTPTITSSPVPTSPLSLQPLLFPLWNLPSIDTSYFGVLHSLPLNTSAVAAWTPSGNLVFLRCFHSLRNEGEKKKRKKEKEKKRPWTVHVLNRTSATDRLFVPALSFLIAWRLRGKEISNSIPVTPRGFSLCSGWRYSRL